MKKIVNMWKSTTKEFLESRLPIPVMAMLKLRSHLRHYKPFTTHIRERNFIIAQQDCMANKIFVKSLPYLAFVDTGNICNLKCPFCPTNNGEYSFSSPKFPSVLKRERCFLDLEKYALVLEAFGETLFSLSLFDWGEPFLNKNIFEMVFMAKEFNIEVCLSTNLNIKDPDLAQKICECYPDSLILSIDGICSETYRKYRRGGDFELVMENVQKIAAYKRKYSLKKPELIWQFLVFKHNEHEIPFVDTFARSHGADIVKISNAYIYHEDWIPVNKKYHPLEARKNSCDFLWTTATIEATGSLSPCCVNRDSRYDFGEFTTAQELRELWNCEKIRASRSFFHKKKPDSKILCDMCTLIKQDAE